MRRAQPCSSQCAPQGFFEKRVGAVACEVPETEMLSSRLRSAIPLAETAFRDVKPSCICLNLLDLEDGRASLKSCLAQSHAKAQRQQFSQCTSWRASQVFPRIGNVRDALFVSPTILLHERQTVVHRFRRIGDTLPNQPDICLSRVHIICTSSLPFRILMK